MHYPALKADAGSIPQKGIELAADMGCHADAKAGGN
jgi:hypothetical protein